MMRMVGERRVVRRFTAVVWIGAREVVVQCVILRDDDGYPWVIEAMDRPWRAEGRAGNSHQAWRDAKVALTEYRRARRKGRD